MPTIAENLTLVHRQIASAARDAGRKADDIRLLAVSKGQPAEKLRIAYEAGQRDFGENYLQEAMDKIATLSRLDDIQWHFIGPLQSNKTKPVASHFHWVHSIDRLKVARRLSEQRPAALPALNLCIQVNIDNETSKAGVAPKDVLPLALDMAELHNVRLRGLMAIPDPSPDTERPSPFTRLARLLESLRRADPRLAGLDTLSMGMSADLAEAVREGATIVRVGTAIFGKRT
ncbi:MAG: YggS family pyridoxal phosphate-dependent enzyme [Porticoccaceae bacterium]|nr:YggS family pyridoxal phosphate-dependent enzyme [Porticoccaceae bacterium]